VEVAVELDVFAFAPGAWRPMRCKSLQALAARREAGRLEVAADRGRSDEALGGQGQGPTNKVEIVSRELCPSRRSGRLQLRRACFEAVQRLDRWPPSSSSSPPKLLACLGHVKSG